MKQCPNIEENQENCPCDSNCHRKGICCECLRYHLKQGSLPACASD